MWSERLIEVPGGRVWVGTEVGDRAGTPVLVLHGGPGSPGYYLSGLADLADERDVIFYDQLGCGRSERPTDQSLWTVERSLAEVEAVRAGLGLEQVHLLGHSWGGFLAVAYAGRHPERVASLVLSSPLISVAGWMEDAAYLLQQLPVATRETIARHEAAESFRDPEYVEAADSFYRRFFCTLDPWPAELQQTLDELGEGPYLTMWGPSEFTQTGNLRGADLTPMLPALAVPSLWICGTNDEVRPERLRSFAACARGRAEVLEGSHCLHLEQPAHYLDLVRDFFAEADDTPGAEVRGSR
jgi:proline iminopeptidase